MTVQTVDDSTFDDDVLGSDIPVIVDFWAEWCGPCISLAPSLDEISADMAGDVLITKLNVDENVVTTSTYGISALPTLVIFSNGKEIARHRGAATKSTLTNWIKGAIS